MLRTVSDCLRVFKVGILLSSAQANFSMKPQPRVFVGTVVFKPATSSSGQDSAALVIDREC